MRLRPSPFSPSWNFRIDSATATSSRASSSAPAAQGVGRGASRLATKYSTHSRDERGGRGSHGGGATRPKRRSRRRNSSSAAARALAGKSGQSRVTKYDPAQGHSP